MVKTQSPYFAFLGEHQSDGLYMGIVNSGRTILGSLTLSAIENYGFQLEYISAATKWLVLTVGGTNQGLHRLNTDMTQDTGVSPITAPSGATFYRMALTTDSNYLALFGVSNDANFLIKIIDPTSFTAHTIGNTIPASGISIIDADASSNIDFYVLMKKTSNNQLAVGKISITSPQSCTAPAVSYYNTGCYSPTTTGCHAACGGTCLIASDFTACISGSNQYFFFAACPTGQ